MNPCKRFIIGSALFLIVLVSALPAHTQDPVFQPKIDIDQQALLSDCLIATDHKCTYKLKDVLNSGGDFWTTPFQPYDSTTMTGDGYGEGANGPRSMQRKVFNPTGDSYKKIPYRFLRMNGLDSQSCFECHNSTGSEASGKRGALARKPYGVAGSAGSNSNAFINPLFPTPETLFIRNPPAVFGSGYQQAVGNEMTLELLARRDKIRYLAKKSPGTKISRPLTAKGINFGTFSSTYKVNPAVTEMVDPKTCQVGGVTSGVLTGENAASIGAIKDYLDDATQVEGVSCDLVIRPFQWKGITSNLRHFVRGALDFHFSMQAFELVGLCDCDRDGKGKHLTDAQGKPAKDGPEVTIGQVTAIASFVAMTRPPIQTQLTTASEKLGQKIFFGQQPDARHNIKLFQNMCANCHVSSLKLIVPDVKIEWPINPNQESAVYVDPERSSTWPIAPDTCPTGDPTAKAMCPSETGTLIPMTGQNSLLPPANRGSLVNPTVSSQAVAIVKRYNRIMPEFKEEPEFEGIMYGGEDQMSALVARLRKPLAAQSVPSSPADVNLGSAAGSYVVGQDYVIPLNPPEAKLSNLQLPRLGGQTPDGSIEVPLLSDLKRHKMGSCLSDPVEYKDASGKIYPLPSQGTDVANIVTDPIEYLTRPLWGVADTGPWLHDGRAMTLTEAILMHGDTATCTGDSTAKIMDEAAPVVDAFEKLKPDEQQALVDFLLSLRLPQPQETEAAAAPPFQ